MGGECGCEGALSGLICEIDNSVGQGNFAFVKEKSGNFRNLWLWQPLWSIRHFRNEKGTGAEMCPT